MLSVTLLFGEDADVLADSNFQLLLLANLLGPLGLAVLSPVLDSLTGPFAVSAADVGLLMSAFTAPGVVLIPLAGGLSDRYGRKLILVGGLLLFGAAGVAIAFTTDFRVALALRLLQGAGFAATTPVIITGIGDMYDGAREAAAQGFRFTGSGLTSMVFPLLAGFTVGVAWQFPFLLYGLAFPVAALVYLRLDEPSVTASDDTGEDDSETARRSLRDLLAHRRVSAMVAVRGFPNMAYVGFLTYNSIIVVKLLNGTPELAGLLAAVTSLSFAVAATQAGRITAAFDSRLLPLIAANVALALGFTVVVFVSTLSQAIIGVVVSGFGFGILLSMYRSIITDLAPTSLRGQLVSLAEGFGRLTVTATPVLMGVVVAALTPQFGFRVAVQAAVVGVAVIAGVGGIVGLVIANRAPEPRYGE